jgi:glutamine---fructose-6-phosphate transaminase (isomerizing)
MCGIFACVSQTKFDPNQVLASLKKLEYRGYDSWGVAVKASSGFKIEKQVGKIGDHQLDLPSSTLALGHTRWATHGGVTVANAHPHLNQDQTLAVVHNGIIENHLDLWAKLKRKSQEQGLKRQRLSQTDSEVFVHLVDSLKPTLGLVEAVRQAFNQLKGLSAFVVADTDAEQLVVVKNGSPVVIGLGKDQNWVASDAHSLLSFTNQVIFLEDNQLAVIAADRVVGYDVVTGQEVALSVQTLDWAEVTTDKGQFDHFSLKEIHEQPEVLRKIATEFETQASELAELITSHDKVYLVGCGTASYAALFASYLLAEQGIEAVALSGSELSHREQFMTEGSLVIFFSQSGETIDITQPLKRVKTQGATTVALVNVMGSTLDRLADHSFLLQAGPEVSVMSTKAFMAMVGVMVRVAQQLAGKASSSESSLLTVGQSITPLLSSSYWQRSLRPAVELLAKVGHCFVLGRGKSYPIALEAALKLKEITYLHAEGFAGGELKHGVIALIETGTPCLIFAPQDETYDAIISSATEVKARGGVIIGVAQENHPVFDVHLSVTEVVGASSLSQVVVAQLLAYHLSVVKGIDPDKPRNLAKSVTVG